MKDWMKTLLVTLLIVAVMVVVALFCGCMSPNMGSKTIVGNHYALPEISEATSDFNVKVYESTEGAVVTTRKDSRVAIEYGNVYTNHILGIWTKFGEMRLNVAIEPLADPQTDEPTTNGIPAQVEK